MVCECQKINVTSSSTSPSRPSNSTSSQSIAKAPSSSNSTSSSVAKNSTSLSSGSAPRNSTNSSSRSIEPIGFASLPGSTPFAGVLGVGNIGSSSSNSSRSSGGGSGSSSRQYLDVTLIRAYQTSGSIRNNSAYGNCSRPFRPFPRFNSSRPFNFTRKFNSSRPCGRNSTNKPADGFIQLQPIALPSPIQL